MSRLERDLFPWIGKRPISEIKAPELLAVPRRVESRGALESAHRIRTIAGQVFRYAVATGRAERDPSGDLKGALPQPTEKHHAEITDPKEVATLLRAIDGYEGHFVTMCALRLAPLFFVRPGELRNAEWSEIDFNSALDYPRPQNENAARSHRSALPPGIGDSQGTESVNRVKPVSFSAHPVKRKAHVKQCDPRRSQAHGL